MKEWLIRLGESLFYDSEEKLYRVRTHCSFCGKDSGCVCFNELEKAEDFIDTDVRFVCSSRCRLISYALEDGIDNIKDVMISMGLLWSIKWYWFRLTGYISEKNASRVACEMDFDYDGFEGMSC